MVLVLFGVKALVCIHVRSTILLALKDCIFFIIQISMAEAVIFRLEQMFPFCKGGFFLFYKVPTLIA